MGQEGFCLQLPWGLGFATTLLLPVLTQEGWHDNREESASLQELPVHNLISAWKGRGKQGSGSIQPDLSPLLLVVLGKWFPSPNIWRSRHTSARTPQVMQATKSHTRQKKAGSKGYSLESMCRPMMWSLGWVQALGRLTNQVLRQAITPKTHPSHWAPSPPDF